jgi:hypothetical protein
MGFPGVMPLGHKLYRIKVVEPGKRLPGKGENFLPGKQENSLLPGKGENSFRERFFLFSRKRDKILFSPGTNSESGCFLLGKHPFPYIGTKFCSPGIEENYFPG